MKHFFSCIGGVVLLGSSPAWAQYPTALPAVLVGNGASATLQDAWAGSNARYYASVDVQRGGEVVLIDRENIRNLTVRTGGTLRFVVQGAAVAPPLAGGGTATLTLEPGATVEIISRLGNGLPFAQGYTTIGGSTVVAGPYSLAIAPDAYYTYNNYDYSTNTGPATAAPAPTVLNGGSTTVANGIALPATVGRLKGVGLTVSANLGVSQEVSGVGTAPGATVTLLSSASGTGLLAGSFSGNLAVQCYIDGRRNAGLGYRHLSSPFYMQTKVSELATASFSPTVNPAYNTNPAVPAASFPTVFGYSTDRLSYASPSPTFDTGWYSPESLGTTMIGGFGYAVNMPAGGTITFTSQGAYTAFGGIYIPGLFRGPQPEAGWYLLGNPFPGPIDWDKMAANSLQYVGSTLYTFKSSGQYTGSYAVYVPGVGGVNGGTNVIPTAQGFFVRTTIIGTANGTPAVQFMPGNVITSYDAAKNATVQRTAADARPRLRLSLHDAAGTQAHETLVYFEPTATTGLDAAHDAEYLPGAGQPLTLASEIAGQRYAINGLPALRGADVAVPLRLAATTAGTYTLRADELANLPAGYHAYLLDAGAGTRLDLAATPSLALALAAPGGVSSRYSLLFTTSGVPLATAPAALAGLASLYPNPAHATATLLLPAAARAGQASPVRVLNSLGQVVRTASQPASAAELALPLDGLAPGIYTVQAHTAVGVISRRLTVE